MTKQELESLLEKGIIDEDAFDKIHSLLPSESSLSGSSRNATPAANRGPGGLPTPAQTASPAPSSPPTASLHNLNLGGGAPPSYAQTTGSSGALPPPGPPGGAADVVMPPPGPPPPAKPVLCHARALYRYAASDARDCSFERDDRIAVHEYMNPDWWMGRNLRTGHEGIFPRNYVQPEPPSAPPAGPPNGYVDEKSAGGYGGPPPQQQPMYGGYPPAPAQQNPYNASVPPMAVAEQGGGNQQGGGGGEGGGGGDGKAGEMGKKFGKKLGNAAIFGAGATLGGNLVNSIF